MLERFNLFLAALGGYKAAAEYLGYSERQFYNIRKRLEQGKPLQKRVANYISGMIEQFDYQEQLGKDIEEMADQDNRSRGIQMLPFPHWE